jgi:hypothetical protein
LEPIAISNKNFSDTQQIPEPLFLPQTASDSEEKNGRTENTGEKLSLFGIGDEKEAAIISFARPFPLRPSRGLALCWSKGPFSC